MKNDTPFSLTSYIERLISRRIYLPFAGLMLSLLVANVFISLIQVQERQRTQGALLIPQVQTYLDSAQQTLDTLKTTLPMLGETEQQILLETTYYASSGFNALYCTDAEGHILHFVAAASPEGEPLTHTIAVPPKTGAGILPRIFTSPLTHQPAVYLETSLPDGRLLIGELDLQTLGQHLATNTTYTSPGDIVFITDGQGKVFAPIASSLPAESLQASGNAAGSRLRLYSINGKWYLGTNAIIPDVDWRVSLRTPMANVLYPHALMLGAALFIFIISGVVASGSIKKDLSRRIITPIRLLSQQAGAVSQGWYYTMSTELTIPQTFQELQRLVHSFGEMAHAIQSRQQELEERTQQYRLLVETSPDGIFLLNRQGRILFCNPQAAQMYGLPEESALHNKNITDFTPPDQQKQLSQALRNLLSEGHVNNILLTLCRADGQRFPVEANAARWPGKEGGSEAFIVVVRDISQRQRNAAFAAFLNQLTTLALQENDLRNILQNVADLLSEYFNATTCYITLWDEQRALTIPTVASGDMRSLYPTLAARPGEGTLTHTVISKGHVLAIENIHESPHVSAHIAVTIPETSFLALPFISGNHKIGAALIGFEKQRTFSGQDIRTAEQVARQISLTLAKTHLLHEERRRRQEAEKLRQITSTLTSTLDLPSVLEQILNALADVLPYDRSTVFLQNNDLLEVVALRGNEKHESLKGLVVPREGDTLTTIIASTRKPLTLADASLDPNYMGWGGTADTRGWMGIPLIAHDEIIGYLTIDSLQPNAYGP
ncbi:MAG: PAS domain S-box protein, partial [Anaerolineae bacterium]